MRHTVRAPLMEIHNLSHGLGFVFINICHCLFVEEDLKFLVLTGVNLGDVRDGQNELSCSVRLFYALM